MTFQKTCEGKEVDLRNPNHPPAVAGDEGYGYHQVGNHDLDGDEVTETVHVIAKAIKDGSEYSWDDGSPWHVYVEEPTGERTYLYSDFVQLGILQVAFVWREGRGANVLIQSETGSGYGLSCAEYHGPGETRATDVVGYGVAGRISSPS
jgi:hypothetical protein